MAKNILKYMNTMGVNATDVCNALGFKQNTFSDWVNAKTYPRIDKIEKMARYFHISKSNLVEESSDLILYEDEKELINIIREHDICRQVMTYAKFLSENKDSK